ncbi:MAG: LacI family DNA-binding transcriptional regulator [Balneolaceae bacterium]|nr:LacI family DNA-binding transcriptional regulator [Balneolaceae bacterium]MDR9447159.1 LacI family DNA-binding transcriptional regulator [Balneolaceae bacterium]
MKQQAKKTTIYAVAKEADVAISTVSRVMNGSENVSERTRQRVERAIRDLNFRPQTSARRLASQQPQMMAVAVPSFTTPFYNEILKGIKNVMSSHEMDIMLYNTGSKDPKAAAENFFDRGTADAVLMLSIPLSDALHAQISSSGIPTVLIGAKHPDYSYFYLDNYRGGRLAARHFAERGYTRPGMIVPKTPALAAEERMRGFIDEIHEANLSVSPSHIVSGMSAKHAGFTEENGYEAAEKILGLMTGNDEGPDGLFCTSDSQAIGAIHAFRRAGVDIPGELGLIGYDNLKLSKYLDLTTIDQHMVTIGEQATQQLMKELNGSNVEKVQIVEEPEVIERSSTRYH